jgi:type I restriction enzyme S subunit
MNHAGKRPLPEGWRWVRLGDHVTKVGSGLTPLGGHTTYVQTGIPLIRSQNVHMNHFVRDGLVFISHEQDAEMEGTRVAPRDILLNITGASIGRVCVAPSELCPANVNQHVSIIRSDGSFAPAFISFFLSTPEFQKFILDSQSGATRQALTKAMIENFLVPLPPLVEQKRIASILREQMAAVERARAATQAQLEAAKALPAAYLRSVFNSPHAQMWPKKPLGEVSEIVMGQSPEGVSYNSNGIGEPLLNGPTEFGPLNPTPIQWTTSPTRFSERGDILLCVRGATTGRKNMADKSYCIGRGLAAIRGKSEQVTTEFLWFALDIIAASLFGQTSGSTFPNLPREKLERVDIVLPSVSEQTQITTVLQKQRVVADQLRKTLEGQLNTINKLPAALLRRAFKGEL